MSEPITTERLKEIFAKHKIWLDDGEDGEQANLRGANLEDANLEDANLRGANLEDANLEDANLRGANLEDANLRGASLLGASLLGANLLGANLLGASLLGANLEDANLEDANLRGANLRGANLRGANLRGANLRGIRVSWDSHILLSQLLWLNAGQDVEKRKIAGLIYVSADWCWDKFLGLNDPLTPWALETFARYATDDNCPNVLRPYLVKRVAPNTAPISAETESIPETVES